MRILTDFMPLFRTSNLAYDRTEKEEGDVRSFHFARPPDLSWSAGQHGIFTLPARPVRGRAYRIFSLASSPGEESIRISTRVREPVSAFKRELLTLRSGDTVRMRGPIGPFYLHDPSRPAVFVAAGIGITPFLGILHDLCRERVATPEAIDLVYGVWKDAFPFESELESLRDEIPGLSLFPRVSPSDVHGCVREMASLRKNDAIYFVSGPRRAVQSVKRTLRSDGIARRNTLSDWFLGYG